MARRARNLRCRACAEVPAKGNCRETESVDKVAGRRRETPRSRAFRQEPRLQVSRDRDRQAAQNERDSPRTGFVRPRIAEDRPVSCGWEGPGIRWCPARRREKVFGEPPCCASSSAAKTIRLAGFPH